MLPSRYRGRYSLFILLSLLVHFTIVAALFWSQTYVDKKGHESTTRIQVKQRFQEVKGAIADSLKDKQSQKNELKESGTTEVVDGKGKKGKGVGAGLKGNEIEKGVVQSESNQSDSEDNKEHSKNISKLIKTKNEEAKKAEAKKAEAKKAEAKKAEAKKAEAKKAEAKKAEAKKEEAKKAEAKKAEAKKAEAKKAEAKKAEAKKAEAKKAEGKKAEGKKAEGKKAEGKKAEDTKKELPKGSLSPAPYQYNDVQTLIYDKKPSNLLSDTNKNDELIKRIGSMEILDDKELKKQIIDVEKVNEIFQKRQKQAEEIKKDLTEQQVMSEKQEFLANYEKINKNYVAPPMLLSDLGKKYKGYIRFVLDEKGYIKLISFKKRSGSEALDKAFMSALLKVGRFDLPEDPKVREYVLTKPIILFYDESDFAE